METKPMPARENEEPQPGGLVEAVDPSSPAAAAGLMAGDRILSIDGQALRDVIDYRFYLEPDGSELQVERDGRRLQMMLRPGNEDAGLSFATALFDRIRTCRCRCVFCFVDQLPEGLRPSLYLKDDDFRLSFLYGSFITLGNLDEEDIQRILDQRLSPLYVSVHATDPVVRGQLMGCGQILAARGLELLRRLGREGIEIHIQIVLCPGMNDREVLSQTVTSLARDYPGVVSVGVVPVAVDPHYLMHHAGLSEPGEEARALSPVTASDCEAVIGAVTVWQEQFNGERGTGFVWAADEFYLRAGLPLPELESYGDFSQYENGIGIAASFEEEGESLIRRLLADSDPVTGRVFLLTGTLAAGQMYRICERLTAALGRELKALVAENNLFGPHVTVTGLLGGRDIVRAVLGASLDQNDLLLLPRACLDTSPRPRFLDNLTLEELKLALSCRVMVAG
ncbi:MAG: DUF512 domain-containing protein [Thermoleophilia bacterium]